MVRTARFVAIDPERHAAGLPGDGAECYRLPIVPTRDFNFQA
jgi:hypothetical protein